MLYFPNLPDNPPPRSESAETRPAPRAELVGCEIEHRPSRRSGRERPRGEILRAASRFVLF